METNQKRVNTIDGIRGLSLFGILLANLLIFQYGIYGKDEITYFNLSSINTFFYYVIKLFIEGAFMPIFTFIFGYSLILMRNSLERNELRIKWHLFRRFIVLSVFGVFHGVFIWEGDILTLYGMMGIFLLIFINRKPKTLLIWASVIFTILTIGSFFDSGEELELTSPEKMATYLDETFSVYSTGTYTEIKNHRNTVDPMELEDEEIGLILALMPFLLSPLFLLGMYAAHKRWFLNPLKEKKSYLAIFLTLIPLGLFLKLTTYIPSFPELSMIGGSLLAIGYICLFAFAYTQFADSPILSAFENVGKLSLTNYMMQSVICTFIFYGYGLGAFARLGVVGGILLAVIVFAVQVFSSTLYLKYFERGPLEKLMRCIVYLKLPQIRRKKPDNYAALK